jgi:hypothetical protein
MLAVNKNSLKNTIQGVSKIHGITSGMSSSYVDNKNSSLQHRSGNVQVLSLGLLKPLNDKLNFVTPADGFRHSLH